jgi:single-strand DNA-binding protein
MLNLTVAGRLGRDAEHKTTQGGTDLCRFSVAADIGFGDNKQTVWVDVTRWGKGAEGLARILRKGSSIAATGEMSLRERNGKTYVQLRADNVTILGTPQAQRVSGGYDREAARREIENARGPADLDDDFPPF